MNDQRKPAPIGGRNAVRSNRDLIMVVLGVMIATLLVLAGYLALTETPGADPAERPKGPVKNPPPLSFLNSPENLVGLESEFISHTDVARETAPLAPGRPTGMDTVVGGYGYAAVHQYPLRD